MDLFAKQNAAIQYLQKYKQMMGGTLPVSDPADTYILEAQEGIVDEPDAAGLTVFGSAQGHVLCDDMGRFETSGHLHHMEKTHH